MCKNSLYRTNNNIYDAIPNVFQSGAHVIVFNFEMTHKKQRVSHHKMYSSHAENCSVEAVLHIHMWANMIIPQKIPNMFSIS